MTTMHLRRYLSALGVLALALLALAGTSVAANATTPTHIYVVRPVTSTGHPVTGYTVTSESIPGFECTDPSPVAVDKNIRFCGFSATYTVACWKASVAHTVYCLRDPLKKQLARIKYVGTFAATKPVAKPVPQELVLNNGEKCLIRDGGAWSYIPGHPNWYGFYSCTGGEDIYGPSSTQGINKTYAAWRVHAVNDAHLTHITTRVVTKAYFVGTHA